MDVVLRAGVQVAQLDPLVIISAMAVSQTTLLIAWSILTEVGCY